MLLFRRCVPALLFAAVVWACASTPVRAQNESSRLVFADTTLLRDTLDLSFARLFELADSLDVIPDSLRAYAIRYQMGLDRLVFLADSLRMPVDSVGPVLERERYNPLAMRSERLTAFGYNTSYSITRQSTSWSNSSTYDLVRGPLVLRNVTSVRIDRTKEGTFTAFHRSKAANTETGWRLTPDLSLGTRINLRRSENDRLGNVRSTSNNEFQVSMRGKRAFREDFRAEANLFGGPFDEPSNSLSNAAKRGFGTLLDGRLDYQGPGGFAFDLNGSSNLRLGRTELPARSSFSIRDLKWSAGGTMSAFPNSIAPLRVNYGFDGDRTQRAVSFTQINGSDTALVDRLLSEPSGTARVDAAVQVRVSRFGNVTLGGNVNRSTRLNAAERKEGIVFERSETHGLGVTADGQFNWRGWSLDAQFSDGRPREESPRRAPVQLGDPGSGALTTLLVDYREESTTRTRTLSSRLTRRLAPQLQINAKGDISLTTYRFDVTDSSYLSLTDGVRVSPSDPHDDYRQSYRVEGVYTPTGVLSTTLALDVSRVLNLFLRANRSSSNREDRVYRADWLWTYRLLSGLTANQRNQVAATYTRSIYASTANRLSMSYTSVTTLNASLTPRLALEMTHNTTYGPNGEYVRAADGLDYFNVSDQARDYTLTSRISYTPTPALTFNLTPTYVANQRDDRSSGSTKPTLRRRSLTFSGGSSLNVRVGSTGRLSGFISRVLETRRDLRYSSGIAIADPRSETDYWSGTLLFSWNL